MSDLRTEPAVAAEPAPVPEGPPTADIGALEAKRFSVGFWVAVGWLVIIIGAALLIPILPLPKLSETSFAVKDLGPFRDIGHILGGDSKGADILSQVIWGARTSLVISIVSVVGGTILGGLMGLIAGYYRGTTDTVLTGIADAVLAFPALVLALALVTFLRGGQSGSGGGNSGLPEQIILIIALGIVSIPILARITRASALTWSEREFVLAAKAQGAKSPRIIFREVLPNVWPAMASIALLGVAVAIIAEGGLSIIGAGITASTGITSWGAIIGDSQSTFQTNPYPVFMTSAIMFLTVFALNYLGDAVRERFDVRESAL